MVSRLLAERDDEIHVFGFDSMRFFTWYAGFLDYVVHW